MPHSTFIKNMVCNRCMMAVESTFKSLGINLVHIVLGEVKTMEPIEPNQLQKLKAELESRGFELIDDKNTLLMERAKASIIHLIHHQDHFELKVNWSHFLSEKLGVDYGQLSSLFSSVNGVTLEQYIIKQKIEKVKEYLFYDELSVKEIAFKMSYSSVAHLSTQFKKVTGLTPSKFKESREKHERKSLDQIL